MVQLPATAAIEYVAAFGRGDFWPGVLLSGGLCPFPPSSIRIRTVWAFCA